MNFEIKPIQNDVLYEIPQISFPAYEEYKNAATQVALYIKDMPVSQDNVKDVKKTLASARKITDALNRERIDLKKKILSSYTIFEGQVKEITSIIDEADSQLRAAVRKLDELEREEKRQTLREIWDKRISQYGEIEQWMPDAFDHWLTPKHLNKSTSIKSAEDDMKAWIDSTYQDLVTASGMGEDYLYEYVRCGNLSTAIQNVKDRQEFIDSIEDEDEFLEDVNSEPVGRYTVFGVKDIALTERLFHENNINYKKEI